jgi:hypothetical protein
MKEFVDSPKEINGIPVEQYGSSIKSRLLNNEKVYHWERGDSLSPIINDMEYCLITPCEKEDIKIGDCVFCEIAINGFQFPMVHRCTDIVERDGLWFRIDSTHGDHFGWTQNVYGKAVGTDIYQKS